MRKFNRILQAFVMALLVTTAAVSFGQLTANANVPVCSGLSCTQPSDCGSKCFCNGPSGYCFED